MIELKPCPWCGVIPTKDDDDYWYAAEHKPDCFLAIATRYVGNLVFDDTEVEAWNRRVDADD